MKGVKKMKKIMMNKKGIDTILAALLMVVIVVVASVMVYAWSTGLLGALMSSNPNSVGKEAMSLEFSGFNCPSSGSCYNVTMNLRNVGSASISLASYYVTDPSGNQYARLNWATDGGFNGPPVNGIAPNALGIVYLNIGPNGATSPAKGCSTCTLTGSSFSFASGTAYTVKIVTSRNNQFQFTITR